jgi:hypothetical protein
MLGRLWFLISLLWAVAELLPEPSIDAKVLEIAIAPFALGLFVEFAARYVVTGRVLRRATSVPETGDAAHPIRFGARRA